jgi:hypothetical protein
VAVIIPFKFTLIDSPGLLYNNGQPSISNYGQSGNGLGNNGYGAMTLPSVPVMTPEEVTYTPTMKKHHRTSQVLFDSDIRVFHGVPF